MLRLLRSIFSAIRNIIWIKINPVSYARSLGVLVGADTRLISIRGGGGTFGSEPYLVKIGNHVTITGGVQFVTHDGGVWVFREQEPDIDVFGSIIIGDNVFVGYGAIIMPGVKIGNNCVVGAGAVVTKNIPDNSVAVGCPAKILYSIDQYYESLKNKKENIRGYSSEEKKAFLIKKYMRKNGN